jgi:hypothetical protein
MTEHNQASMPFLPKLSGGLFRPPARNASLLSVFLRPR